MSETAMVWGFQHSDGWFQLLDDVSRELEAEIERVVREEGEEAASYLRASTVKEKFGSLRLYTFSSTDEMDMLISEAELRSSRTCEITGAPGRIRSINGWYMTLCDEEYYKALATKHLREAYHAGQNNSKTDYEEALKSQAERLKRLLEPGAYTVKERLHDLAHKLYYNVSFALRHPIWEVRSIVRNTRARVKRKLWRMNRKRKGLWVA